VCAGYGWFGGEAGGLVAAGLVVLGGGGTWANGTAWGGTEVSGRSGLVAPRGLVARGLVAHGMCNVFGATWCGLAIPGGKECAPGGYWRRVLRTGFRSGSTHAGGRNSGNPVLLLIDTFHGE
jgi:hypothetical protein